MKRTTHLALLILCIPLATAAPVWPDKNRWTPNLVQTGFGPNGSALPFDGAEYCGPTSASMALGYLNNAGFTQLLGPGVTKADYLNLVKVMTGLMGSSDSNGTFGEDSLNVGLDHYFSAKGIGPANRTITPGNGGNHRTLTQIAASNVDQNILVGVIGWYVQQDGSGVWDREGGHFIVVTDQDPTNGTLTIHNAYPNALLDQPNLPTNVLQTLPMAPFAATRKNTDGNLYNATYLQFNTDEVGPDLRIQGILEQVQTIHVAASALPASGFVPQDWRIDDIRTLNTGGGDLVVDTRVTGTGAIRKRDEGNLVFRRPITLTGDHQVRAGGLISRLRRGTPFGTGSLALSGTGKLELHPDDAAPAPVNLSVASRPPSASRNGATLSFAGGNRIELYRGANPSLTVSLGGNAGNGIPNLVPTGWASTLVIHAGDLGDLERLRIQGQNGNLPPVNHGMVRPTIVGSRGAPQDGGFLTYIAAPDDRSGFRRARTVTGDLNAATASTVYRATTNQHLTGPGHVYALQVEDGVAINGAGQSLGIGDGANPAGVILNRGRIGIGSLDFGAAPGAIYTNAAGGWIGAALTGDHGLVKFGLGRLVLAAPSPQLNGAVFVNNGTLVVNAPGALGGVTNPVTLRQGSVLKVAAGATVAGAVRADGYALINLEGGTLGNVRLRSTHGPSGPIQGATLRGEGRIAGDLVLNGYLAGNAKGAPGTLTIDGIITAKAGGAFIWSLPALLDSQTGTPGTDWNTLELTNPNASFGTKHQHVAFFFDFAPGQGPDSGNAFWQADHKWTLFTFSRLPSAADRVYLDFPSAAFPSGYFSHGHDRNVVSLRYTAATGTARRP